MDNLYEEYFKKLDSRYAYQSQFSTQELQERKTALEAELQEVNNKLEDLNYKTNYYTIKPKQRITIYLNNLILGGYDPTITADPYFIPLMRVFIRDNQSQEIKQELWMFTGLVSGEQRGIVTYARDKKLVRIETDEKLDEEVLGECANLLFYDTSASSPCGIVDYDNRGVYADITIYDKRLLSYLPETDCGKLPPIVETESVDKEKVIEKYNEELKDEIDFYNECLREDNEAEIEFVPRDFNEDCCWYTCKYEDIKE